MATAIFIKRVIKENRVDEFLVYYKSHRGSDHPGFIGEFLTRLDKSDSIPEAMSNFNIGSEEGVTFVNVIFFENAKDFEDHFKPKIMFDEFYEIENRQRITMHVVENVSQLTPKIMNL